MEVSKMPAKIVERHANVQLECRCHRTQPWRKTFYFLHEAVQVIVQLKWQASSQLSRELIEKLLV